MNLKLLQKVWQWSLDSGRHKPKSNTILVMKRVKYKCCKLLQCRNNINSIYIAYKYIAYK